MNTLPLHPAVVHLPLGLAMLMPFVAAGFGWAVWTGRVRPRAWLAVVALQLVLVGSGLVAMNTGEAEEDRVESVVQEAALSRHEALADQFVWSAAATLGITALVLLAGRRHRPGATRALTATAVAATIGVSAMALRVGHAGGQLVYAHGAAAAYASPAASQPGGGTTPSQPRRGHRDGDDRLQ